MRSKNFLLMLMRCKFSLYVIAIKSYVASCHKYLHSYVEFIVWGVVISILSKTIHYKMNVKAFKPRHQFLCNKLIFAITNRKIMLHPTISNFMSSETKLLLKWCYIWLKYLYGFLETSYNESQIFLSIPLCLVYGFLEK